MPPKGRPTLVHKMLRWLRRDRVIQASLALGDGAIRPPGLTSCNSNAAIRLRQDHGSGCAGCSGRVGRLPTLALGPAGNGNECQRNECKGAWLGNGDAVGDEDAGGAVGERGPESELALSDSATQNCGLM